MTYIPLKEAAKTYGVEEKVLTQLISAGMIETKEEAGETLVAVDKNGNGSPQTKEEIIAEKFAHLQNEPITVTQAAQRYKLSRQTVLEWTSRSYIQVIKPGYRMELNEADVAYCAEVYHQKAQEYDGRLRGVNIFDKYGNPYSVKHPELAIKRRKRQ
jgi:excisionase family DNA binding protein